MPSLVDRKCQPLAAGTPKLTPQQIETYLRELPGWSVADRHLSKVFTFANYYETTAFLNATAWISHRQDHHPDIILGYNKITLKYSTHSVGGLSDNDFICAAKLEWLLR